MNHIENLSNPITWLYPSVFGSVFGLFFALAIMVIYLEIGKKNKESTNKEP